METGSLRPREAPAELEKARGLDLLETQGPADRTLADRLTEKLTALGHLPGASVRGSRMHLISVGFALAEG